jgi:hypothetical protein
MKTASLVLFAAAFFTLSAQAQRQASIFSNPAGCRFVVSGPNLSAGETAKVKVVFANGKEESFEGVLERVKFIGPRLDAFTLKYKRLLSRKQNYLFLHTIQHAASAELDNGEVIDLPKGAYLEDGYFPGARVVDDKGNFHEVSNTRGVYCVGST